jgi:hypothetical protein
MPDAIARWLDGEPREPAPAFALAEDVRPCFGRFAPHCGEAPRSSGIRGLPPGFDSRPRSPTSSPGERGPLASELDEQGLQVAALARAGRNAIVRVDEVSICSPLPPHLPGLGRCGAHFVGLNARALRWAYEGRPASELVREHWSRRPDRIYALLGLTPDPRHRAPS